MTTLITIITVLLILCLILSCVGLYLNAHWNGKSNKKQTKVTNKTQPKKKKYLDFVYLTDCEYKKLNDLFWEEKLRSEIWKLNNYIWSSGKKYKSHYYTLIQWHPELQNKEVIKAVPQTKLELKKGEILFLHSAWWNNTKIAERIGCTPQGVGTALRRWK